MTQELPGVRPPVAQAAAAALRLAAKFFHVNTPLTLISYFRYDDADAGEPSLRPIT